MVPLIQLAAGMIVFHSDALLSSTYLLGFALCVVAGATLATSDDKDLLLNGLMGGFVAAAVVSAAIALAQWQEVGVGQVLLMADMPRGGRPYGNLGQPNHLATLLSLGIVSLVYWYEEKRISGVVLSLCSAFLGFALLMTQSRAAWLILFVLGVWYGTCSRRFESRITPAKVVSGWAVFVMGVLVWRPLNDALFLSSATTLGERVKPGMRLAHWQALWDALMTRPWAGFGWNQVSMAQLSAAEQHHLGGELLFNSHNELLDLLIWNGLPIGGLLIVLLAFWFVRHIRACRSVQQCALLAAVAAVFVHGMVEYPLSYAYFLLPVGLMMGALEGLRDRAPTRRWPIWMFAGPVLLSTGMVVYTGIEYMKVEQAARVARLVGAGIGVDRVAEAPPPDTWLIDGQREYIRFIGTQARPGMSPEELEWMRRVTTRFTYSSAMFRYALATALNGHPDNARHTLETLCNLHGKERCDEGREAWEELRKKHPQVSSVTFPR